MSIKRDCIIIGLTGSFGSGCTLVSNYLKEKLSFNRYSLSDFIKEIAKKEKDDDYTRFDLQDIGNRLRRNNKDTAFLAKKVIKLIEENPDKGPIVIDSFRNQGEVLEFLKFSNFFLIAIDANFDVRWKRLSPQYKDNLYQFKIDDERDKGEDDIYGQQVQKCVDMADIVIINDEDFPKNSRSESEFIGKLAKYVEMIIKPGLQNPTKKEAFMNIARAESLRSLCLQRKVGAVIVKIVDEKRALDEEKVTQLVIATGYNEVPLGIRPCIEQGGCYRDKVKFKQIESLIYCPFCGNKFKKKNFCSKCHKNMNKELFQNKYLDFCRALHAEETAILQASKLGSISLENAWLYTTTFPCFLCSKMIVDIGIKKVIYIEPYPSEEARELLNLSGIVLDKFEGVTAQGYYKLYRYVKI
jgi:deoxycytidylate deaminase